jgi:hypothetical protein
MMVEVCNTYRCRGFGFDKIYMGCYNVLTDFSDYSFDSL